MYKPLISLLTSVALAVLATTAYAEQSDFKKPIELKAESQFLDGKNKKSVFIDNVQIVQGSLNILADRVEVEATEGKGKEVFSATGKPAIYRQKLDDGRTVEAKAFEIRYEVGSRTISLTGKAELLQNSSVVKGDSIVYNMEKEQLIAKGDGSGTGRVTTVFSTQTIDALKQEKQDKQDKKPKNPTPDTDAKEDQR
ncbi:lipopolysaccharide transport periplasmic protein LptA [Aestuariibacter sp. GS-14]|uniref:lipopolysaccharide transport periplasmic protein LptA n=1 Tax=Aestuariibacter sp. GS-14 TaxID=2590670 RepID=UPI00112D9A78|nr:lipopolysaccharide transport periplasmic protein LptA [Aestuariibacter sp. GS-14]TPV57761.1 lipopolysaccharide transport periplasmic protein LptA [Aestuariibacter sp. GS-14]